MKIAIASDHAGFKVKEVVKSLVKKFSHSCQDFGTNSEDSVDYPDYAFKVAEAVASGAYERGILVCGSGLGMAIAANKVKGIRAVTVHNELTAEMSRRHNDANVLCLGARILQPSDIEGIVKVWLATPFEKERHTRRLDKISQYEKGCSSKNT
ncbi:MAG: ribose 5-phosphate isomerase B [Candidatus Brocadiia bacterium]